MEKRIFVKILLVTLFIVLLAGKTCMLTSFAATEEGWIEVQVSIPENFNDQIYIQFQEKGKEDEAFYDNFVQVLPENNYTARIKLPVGTYVVTCMNAYENPLIYDVELSSETVYPIVVTSDTAATLVKFNCTVVPIEDLPEIEGEYPEEVLVAAQKASEEKSEKTNEESTESDYDENIISEDDSQKDEKLSDNVNKEPLYNILIGFFSTCIFGLIIGGVLCIFFNFKQNNDI